jgi:hypothetical protein
MRRLIALVGTVLLGAQALAAQTQAKTFDLGAHIGQQVFAKGTALENTPFVGLDATYELPWNPLSSLVKGSTLGVGLAVDVSRPVTRGDQFQPVAFDFGDTTFLYAVAQRVTLLQSALQAVVGVPIGKARVYGFGGTGIYSFFLDPRAMGKNQKFSSPMVTFGGGVNYAVSSSIGFRAQAKLVTYTDFDRAKLDASQPYIRDQRIKDALPAPDATSRNPTNMQYSLVFQYIPGGK